MLGMELARAKDFAAKRISSYDTSGRNRDAWPLGAGETKTLAEIEGCGAISHLWFTIGCEDRHYLRKLVLRAYWDGAQEPAIESPVGDFFNVGHGFRASHSCAFFSTSASAQELGGGMAMNAWLSMPFRQGAKIEIENGCECDVRSFYFYVDYQVHPSLPEDVLYFHAQWKRDNPCAGWTGHGSVWQTPAWSERMAGPEGANLDGRNNYLLLDTEGRGHFVGCNVSVQNLYRGWWGEGDDMFFVDGEDFPPDLHGTGTEDYFCHAWGMQPNSTPYHGVSLWQPRRPQNERDPDDWIGLWTNYRLHVVDPVPFTKSLIMGIEHGHANNRSDDWSSVAYWYLDRPEHKRYCELPPPQERIVNWA